MVSLPLDGEESSKKNTWPWKAAIITILTVIIITGVGIHKFHSSSDKLPSNYQQILKKRCPYIEKLEPPETELLKSSYFIEDSYKNHSIEVWKEAIRIPTQVIDEMGPVDKDKRWDIFYKFENYLNSTYPTFVNKCEVVHVNTHGLVYILKGSDSNLKPIMLTGHQDVVPVPENTIKRWTYPPFSGHYDGTYIWGRGASDCKNTVVAMFEAMESLAEQNFQPTRTVIIALGFDEEDVGLEGASHIGNYLEKRYGKDSMFMILDEGGNIAEDIYGIDLALPDTGEKGRVNIVIDLETTGGHSSVPPPHTAVGIMSEIITTLEKNPFQLNLEVNNPFYSQLQCQARFSGETMDKNFKSDIINISKDTDAKKRVLNRISQDLYLKYLVSTSQAVDIFNGGLKINALPEQVTAQINYRIDVGSSVKEVENKVESVVQKFADKHHLELDGFGIHAEQDVQGNGLNPIQKGKFSLHTTDVLEPAPVTSVIGNPTWRILAGTVRHVFEDDGSVLASGREMVVTPSLTTGNTDTRYYWSLTPNIYRFGPIRGKYSKNIHAIDERVNVDAHLETVAFYYDFILNTNDN